MCSFDTTSQFYTSCMLIITVLVVTALNLEIMFAVLRSLDELLRHFSTYCSNWKRRGTDPKKITLHKVVIHLTEMNSKGHSLAEFIQRDELQPFGG